MATYRNSPPIRLACNSIPTNWWMGSPPVSRMMRFIGLPTIVNSLQHALTVQNWRYALTLVACIGIDGR